MKSWIDDLFVPHKQHFFKIHCFKYIGLLRFTKIWLHLLVNLSTSTFRKFNLLIFSISISQYSICSCFMLLSFPWAFEDFCSFIFKLLIFYFHLENLTSMLFILFKSFYFYFRGFLMCVTMKLRNVAFWQMTKLGLQSQL